MHGVILEHVCHVVHGEEVVDSYNFDVISLGRCTEDETSDAAEAINTYFCHICLYWVVILHFTRPHPGSVSRMADAYV